MAGSDREAFAAFYDRYASLVYTLVLRVIRDRAEADDLVQEIFIQLWRKAEQYKKDRGSPEAWVVTVARTRSIDKLRSMRRKGRGFASSEELERAAERESELSETEQVDARLTVKGALDGLPPEQRKALELAYFEGLTQSEISDRLKTPLGTVKTRIRLGLQRLRQLFGVALQNPPA